MLTSNFSLQKRQEEEKQLKKIVIVGFAGSMILHGIAIIFFPSWFTQPSSKKASKPIELIIVEPPKPEPIPKPVETKVLPKPIPKPKSLPEPPQVKALEPPKPIETKVLPVPKPPQIKTPEPPKPIAKAPQKPQQILTNSSTPTANSLPTAPSTSSAAPSTTQTTGTNQSAKVAVNSAPSRPIATPAPAPVNGSGVSCLTNCKPEYPSALDGKEGSASVRLTIDQGGNVVGAKLANPNSNAMVNRQALLAARKMKFSSVDYDAGVSVVVTIKFTLAGSRFDRQARQRQEEIEQQRQAQLEKERQAKLERERQHRERALQEQRRAELQRKRQAELERQKQEAAETVTDSAPATPSLTPIDKDDEMLRKFRERMQNHQNSN